MGATAGWLRAHRLALGVVLALLLLYTLAGFLLVPRLARNAAIDYVQRDLHRHLTIGEVRFNPFTFTVQIRQLALTEADGAPIAKFALLRIEASGDLRPEIARALVKANVDLLRMDRSTEKLESVFLRLTGAKGAHA